MFKLKSMSRRYLALLFIGSSVAGCSAVGPDYKTPELEGLKNSWNQKIEDNFVTAQDLSSWWTKLQDPILDEFITRGIEHNLDLKIAYSTILQHQAMLGISKSSQYPSVTALGSVTRAQTNESLSGFTGVPSLTDKFENIGVAGSWEVDLFGRIQRQVEADEALYDSSKQHYRDVFVSIVSEIARSYVEVRSLQNRLNIARKNVANQTSSVRIAKARYKAELVSELDVTQAQQNLFSSQASVPQLEAGLTHATNRLAVLVGVTPGTINSSLSKSVELPVVPTRLLVAIPRDVLRQRPDIRVAERQLAAQTARIGVATADLYPNLTLSGLFGFTQTSGSLLSNQSNYWSFGPQLRWSVFDAGRTKNRIEMENERAEQARFRYEQTVLNALADVENSLSSFSQELERQHLLQSSADAARKSVKIAKNQYKSGLASFQSVLDSERVVFAIEDQLAESDAALLNYFVAIYRSMGGSWTPSLLPPYTQLNSEE